MMESSVGCNTAKFPFSIHHILKTKASTSDDPHDSGKKQTSKGEETTEEENIMKDTKHHETGNKNFAVHGNS